MDKTQVFARQATGLIKEFSALEMTLIALALIFSLQSAELEFPWYFGFNPGANLPLALFIVSFPYIFLMLAYWVVGVIMPRSGNDYVWVSRIFSPVVGFGWSTYYLLGLFAPSIAGALLAVDLGLGGSLSFWGVLYSYAPLVSFGTWLETIPGEFAFSMLMLVVFVAISMVGYKYIKAVLYGGWIVAGIGIVTMWGLLGLSSPAMFASKWNALLGQYSSYSAVFTMASNSGWSTPQYTLAATLVSLPFAVLFPLGGNFVNVIAGEAKNIRKSIPIALFVSLIVGQIIWAISGFLTTNAVGSDWMSAIGYVWNTNSAAYSAAIPYAPSMPLLLSVLAYPNQLLLAIITISFVVGSLPNMFFFFWIPSRYFFAWSFDRTIPTKFADVNSRFGTAHNAILLTALMGTISVMLWDLTTWSAAYTIGLIIWFSALILPSIGVAILPYVKKDLFTLAPTFMQKKVAKIPIITYLGGASAICFSALTYIAAINPAIASITLTDLYVTIAIVILSAVIYYASLVYHKRHGLDIRMVATEIPPE
jgi:amino acid transporter